MNLKGILLLLALLIAWPAAAYADGYCYIGYVYDAAGQRIQRHYYCVTEPDDPCYDCPVENPPSDSRPAGGSATGVGAKEGYSIATATVFPNPTTGPFVLVVPESLRPCTVSLLTASGGLVKRVMITTEETDFDLTPQAPGTYYLRVAPPKGRPQFFKIVKR